MSFSKLVLSIPLERAGFALIDLRADAGLRFPHMERMALHYVLEGEVELEFAGEPKTRLGVGDFVCLPRGAQHALSAPGAAHSIHTTALRALEPTDEPIELVFGDTERRGARLLSGSFDPRRTAADYTVPTFPDIMVLKVGRGPTDAFLPPEVCAVAFKGAGAGAFATSLVHALFVQAARAAMKGSPVYSQDDLAAFRAPRIAAVRRLLERYYQEPWTVGRLAAEAGMAKSTFVAAFTAVIGEPPSARLTAIRLSEGRRLLGGSRSIGEIAQAVGYRSQAAFTRAFRRYYGETPRVVRAALRKA